MGFAFASAARAPGGRERDRAVDRGDDGAGIAAVGLARLARHRERRRQHGQGGGKSRGGVLGRIDHRNRGAERARGRGVIIGIADGEEHGVAAANGLPGLERDFARDAGRFAEGEGERRRHMRTSTNAARRKSRM